MEFCSCSAECDISVSKLLGFETFPFFLMVSVSVSEIFGIEKSIGIGFEKNWYRKKYRYRFRRILVSKKSFGIGFEKIWYRKKYRYWFRKILVSKKVSVSVSKKFGIEKSIGIGFEKFGIEKGHKYS